MGEAGIAGMWGCWFPGVVLGRGGVYFLPSVLVGRLVGGGLCGAHPGVAFSLMMEVKG